MGQTRIYKDRIMRYNFTKKKKKHKFILHVTTAKNSYKIIIYDISYL